MIRDIGVWILFLAGVGFACVGAFTGDDRWFQVAGVIAVAWFGAWVATS